MKIAIMTDSTAYIPEDVREKLKIHMVSLNVVFGEESYQEETEIAAEAFYARVRETGELPKTSQPATGLFVEKFEELAKEYDAVICVHLSSGISGTYQGAVTAAEMVEGIDVHVFDSEISSRVQGFYVEEAAQMALAGKSVAGILGRLEEMKRSLRAYFVVKDLMHLQRGGRLSSTQAIVGSLLQVKPVLHFENKIIVPFEKIRTFNRAIKRVLELFDEVASEGKPIKAVVVHCNAVEEAEEIKQQIEAAYPHVEISIGYIGAVIGTHLGEGSVGLGWYTK